MRLISEAQQKVYPVFAKEMIKKNKHTHHETSTTWVSWVVTQLNSTKQHVNCIKIKQTIETKFTVN